MLLRVSSYSESVLACKSFARQENEHDKGCVRFLWADSSPDRHHDWLWCEQRNILDSMTLLSCFRASKQITHWLKASDDPWSVPEHCKDQLQTLLKSINHHIHTPVALGSGKKMADVAQKAAAMAHTFSLENPTWAQISAFMRSFISVTTDLGAESGLAHFRVSLSNLFPSWRSLYPLEADW